MTTEPSNKNEPKVMLISSDGMEFVLPSSSASLSVLVCDALNIGEEADDNSDHGTSDVVDEQSMPRMDMLKVKGDCLQKVVDFLRHYEIEPAIEVPVPLPAESLEEVSNCRRLYGFDGVDTLGMKEKQDCATSCNF